MRTEPSPRAHSQILDVVRGGAVVAVVVWHAFRLTVGRGMDPTAVPPLLWPLGILRFGVDVFFVLSGLLVVRSWESIRKQTTSRVRAGYEFIQRRARRILPGYLLCLVVLVPLVSASLLDDPRRLLAFATLNQYVKFWLPEKVNPVMWSLTTEWHFYLLVPAVAWLLTRLGRWPVYAACCALTVVWWVHTPLQLPASFVFGRLDQFVAGAIVGQLAAGAAGHPVVRFAQRGYVAATAVAVVVALGIYHGASLGLSYHPVLDAFVHPVVAACAALLLLRVLTSAAGPSTATGATLAWLGTVSFGLYLWHYPILDHGLRWTRTAVPLPTAISLSVAVPVLIACSLVAAQLSYRFVERPVVASGTRPEQSQSAGTLTPWPSRRSPASKPSSASPCAARPIPTPSSRQAS